MKHIKHIHDEDYDFSIKLMVPLLTILVCTICLCATTWAWYTASVSTGVTSITAKANVTETIIDSNNEPVPGQNGLYTLTNNTDSDIEYVISFHPGSASYGYYAELEISNVENTSFLDLFVNRVFAEDNPKYYYYQIKQTDLQDQDNPYKLKIKLQKQTSKQIKIKYVWAEKDVEGGDIKYPGDTTKYYLLPSDPIITSDSSIVDKTKSYSLLNIEPDDEIPSYKYSVRFIDNNTYEELRPEISEETIYETVLLDDYLIEGYEILSDSYDDIDEEGIYFYIDTEKEMNTFVVLYKKNPDSDGEQITNNESNTSIDTDMTPPVIENSSNEAETPNTDSSDATDQNNSSEMPNTDETEQSDTNNVPSDDQPVESLLITDYTDEETTENITSSDDIDSETE